MQEAAGSELLAQSLEKNARQSQFGGTERSRVPLLAVHIVNGNKCGFAAHREPDIAGSKFGIDLIANCAHARPLVFGVRLRYPRVFVNSRYLHLVHELHFTFTD